MVVRWLCSNTWQALNGGQTLCSAGKSCKSIQSSHVITTSAESLYRVLFSLMDVTLLDFMLRSCAPCKLRNPYSNDHKGCLFPFVDTRVTGWWKNVPPPISLLVSDHSLMNYCVNKVNHQSRTVLWFFTWPNMWECSQRLMLKTNCVNEPERSWIMLPCLCASGATMQACSAATNCTVKYRAVNEPQGLPGEQRGSVKVK